MNNTNAVEVSTQAVLAWFNSSAEAETGMAQVKAMSVNALIIVVMVYHEMVVLFFDGL
ncbi:MULTISPECIES: hypothetical protein [Methylomonas]|uniref:hypothetical protein n=1 Tax=Methylomonas TaxID=416 RepID=UPI001E43B71B|nr:MULTISPECIES: hypothetical protein [Methylomonas]